VETTVKREAEFKGKINQRFEVLSSGPFSSLKGAEEKKRVLKGVGPAIEGVRKKTVVVRGDSGPGGGGKDRRRVRAKPGVGGGAEH